MRSRKRRAITAGSLFLRVDGGCDDCSAYTDLIDHGAHVFSLAIRHDPTCPYYRSLERTQP